MTPPNDPLAGLLRPRLPLDPALRARRVKTYVSEGRIEVNNSSVGFIVMLFAYLGIAYLAADSAAHDLLVAWKYYALLVAAFWSGSIAEFVIRKPDDARIWQHWIPRARLIMAACDICVAASVWVLLPAMSDGDFYLALGIYILFILFQAVASTTATEILGFALVSVFGSLIAYCLLRMPDRGAEMAAVLVFFAIVIYSVRRFLRKAIVDALDLRFRAEESEAALEAALATVAAERDSKVRFIASASHDLQQPIQAAWMFAESRLAGADGAATERATAGMRAAFASVQALLESMLDHLRLDAGVVTARRERVAVGQLIAEITAEQSGAAEAAGLELRSIASSLTLETDHALLKRALSNLVVNAVRHSGGCRICLGARQNAGRITFWVVDDGRGVAQADRAKVFEEFVQGTDHGGSSRGGFGLGLPAVRQIAQLLGGSAHYDERWQNGAAFAITVPR